MLKAIDAANYFLKKDENNKLFNTNLINRNGRTFYEGNARLNKYLHLAQNIYIAKTGCPLIDIEFYAYDNGAVAVPIQDKYRILLKNSSKSIIPDMSEEQIDFLNRFFIAFQNSSIDELIQLSHEDSEWLNKQGYYNKNEQKMDSMRNIDEYREQYADIIKVLDRIAL